MFKIPITDETKKIAANLVWFKTPESALNDTYTFLAYLMKNGTLPEVTTMKKLLGMEAFEEVLSHMPLGIMDKRSWVYWNTVLNKSPDTPLPQRDL